MAEDSESCGNHGGASDALNKVTEQWQTPRAGEEDSGSGLNSRGEAKLKAQAQLWLTPDATLAPRRPGIETKANGRSYARRDPTFAEQAETWGTPRAADAASASASASAIERGFLALCQQTENWQTPLASMVDNGNDSGSAQRLERGTNPGLKSAAEAWPTPQARDCKGASSIQESDLNSHAENWPTPDASADKYRLSVDSQQSHSLEPTARNWSSPCARIVKGGGAMSIRKDGKSRLDMLDWQAEAFSRPDPETSDGPVSSLSVPTSRPRLLVALTRALSSGSWDCQSDGATPTSETEEL